MYIIKCTVYRKNLNNSLSQLRELQTDIARRKVYSSTYHTQFSDLKLSTSTSKMMKSKETISTEKLGKKPLSYQPEYPLPDIKKVHGRTDLPATGTVIEHPAEG